MKVFSDGKTEILRNIWVYERASNSFLKNNMNKSYRAGIISRLLMSINLINSEK